METHENNTLQVLGGIGFIWLIAGILILNQFIPNAWEIFVIIIGAIVMSIILLLPGWFGKFFLGAMAVFMIFGSLSVYLVDMLWGFFDSIPIKAPTPEMLWRYEYVVFPLGIVAALMFLIKNFESKLPKKLWQNLSIILAIVAVGLPVAELMLQWYKSWPAPQSPLPQMVWVYMEVAWPLALYWFLISAGIVTTWVFGASGIWPAIITAILSLLGALMLHQPTPWFCVFGVSFIGWGLLMLMKVIKKPSGATPLVTSIVAMVIALIYMLAIPLGTWSSISAGIIAGPVAFITATIAYSTGTGLASSIQNALTGEG